MTFCVIGMNICLNEYGNTNYHMTCLQNSQFKQGQEEENPTVQVQYLRTFETTMCVMRLPLQLILLTLNFGTGITMGALPQFSWDTLPVFFHSANSSGPYSQEALNVIAKYAMVTIEKKMGFDDKNMDDEDAMVLAMQAVKKTNPNVATYFYMNSYKDVGPMTRMAREVKQYDYLLRTEDGQFVKSSRGTYVYDQSNPKVRKWWLNICLNATKVANGDGCYCDSSQHTDGRGLKPLPSPAKLKAWGEGLLTLTKEVQNALGDDKLLIGKVAQQPYVKAVQIEKFYANNDSINNLTIGIRYGKVMQAHVPINVSCRGDLTDYMAAFLIGVGEQTYFGCGNWYSEGNDSTPFIWKSEYDKPLGKPTAPAKYRLETGIWTREFESGTKVTFDTNINKGTIQWDSKKVKHSYV